MVDDSDIFYFFCSGEGKGEAPGGGGGGEFLLKIPGKGRGFPGGWGRGGQGAGWVFAGIWGGGAKYLFSGPKFPPSNTMPTNFCYASPHLPGQNVGKTKENGVGTGVVTMASHYT